MPFDAHGPTSVQDPGEAEYSKVPEAALEGVVDVCADAAALGRYLGEHCKRH